MSAAQAAIPGVVWPAPTPLGQVLDQVADQLGRGSASHGGMAMAFHGALASAAGADPSLRAAARTHLVGFLGAPVGVWLQHHTAAELIDACRFAAQEVSL